MRNFLFALSFLFTTQCLAQSQGSLLLDAVKRNEFRAVEELVNKGADLNFADAHLATPLMWATYNKNFELFRFLASKGADHRKKGAIMLDSLNYFGSIMNLAAALNDTAILSYCLDQLHIPVTDKGYKPDDKTESGPMPIHLAALNGHIEASKILLMHGAPINAGDDRHGQTPLMMAFMRPRQEYIEYLGTIDSIDMHVKDRDGLTVFHHVCFLYNNADLTNVFIQAGSDYNGITNDGTTPLILAGFNGNYSTVTALLSAGADYRVKANDQKSAFDIAMERKKYETAFLIKKKAEGYSPERLTGLHDSIVYAVNLHLTADSLQTAGNISRAESLHKQSRSLYFSIFGEKSPAYSMSSYNLGVFYFDNRDFGKAIPMLRDAAQSYRNAFKEKKADYASIMIRQGVAEKALKVNDSALIHLREVMAVHEKINRKIDSNYLTALSLVTNLLLLQDSAATGEKLAGKAISFMEQNELTSNHYYIEVLNNMALLNIKLGRIDSGWAQLERASTLCKDILGESHITYTTIRSNIVLKKLSFKEYEPVIPEIKKHLAHLKNSGQEKVDIYGIFLIQLAQAYAGLNLTEEAERYTDSASMFYSNPPGMNPVTTFNLLLVRGETYKSKKNYDSAIYYFKQARDISKSIDHLKTSFYCRASAHIAEALRLNGELEEAIKINEELLGVYNSATGESGIDRAGILHNLAMAQSFKGNFLKAIDYMNEANEIFRTINNGSSYLYAAGLNNIAMAYFNLGLSDKAIEPVKQALKILDSLPGEHEQLRLTALNNMALIYTSESQYKIADSLLSKAISIANSLKITPQEYLTILCNMGTTYMNSGNSEAARSLFYRVLQDSKNTGSKDFHPKSLAMVNLGDLLLRENRYDSAKYHIRNGLQLLKSNSFGNNPIYFEGQILYAIAMLKTGDMPACATILREVIVFYKKNLQYTSSFLGTTNLSDYLNKTNRVFGLLLSVSQHEQMAETRNECLNFLLALKGLGLQNRNDLTLAINNSQDKNLQQLYKEFMEIKQKINLLYTNNGNEKDIDAAGEKFNRLEEELIRRSSKFQQEVANRKTDWKTVQQKLKPDEAALEFIDTHNWGFQVEDTVHYAVFIVRSTGQPQLMQLCREDELELRVNDGIGKRPDYVRGLYDAGETGAASLYQLIWKPLAASLQGINTLYYAPSGLLHRINFSAITVPSGKQLGSDLQFHLMGSIRDVARYEPTYVTASTDKLLIMGGIRYDPDSTSSKFVPGIKLNDDLALARKSADFKELAALPFSEKEVLGIETISKKNGYPYRLLRGRNATEDSLKYFISQSKSPGVVHLSTHGFFVPDEVARNNRRTQDQAPWFASSSNVFFRSGIFFAGANQVLKGKKPIKDMEDGVVTSYDITNANLINTKLLVLSSCESGVGRIDNIEGVYGLQRAVRMAGCKNLVMSLWEVNDASASEFMDYFYTELLKNKKSIYQSYRYAQETMAKLHPGDPYRWAAFVLME